MSVDSIIEKVEEGLYISVKYEDKGIVAKKTNVEENFMKNAREDNFINYYKISFVLLASTKILRVNFLSCVDKKSDEWVGKRENSVEFTLDKIKELEKYIEEKFCENKR